MTNKDYNIIRSAVFNAAKDITEVDEALKTAGIALVVECNELPDKHSIIVLTARTQLNDTTLRKHGFDPAKVRAHVRFVLHQQTKCADIL